MRHLKWHIRSKKFAFWSWKIMKLPQIGEVGHMGWCKNTLLVVVGNQQHHRVSLLSVYCTTEITWNYLSECLWEPEMMQNHPISRNEKPVQSKDTQLNGPETFGTTRSYPSEQQWNTRKDIKPTHKAAERHQKYTLATPLSGSVTLQTTHSNTWDNWGDKKQPQWI